MDTDVEIEAGRVPTDHVTAPTGARPGGWGLADALPDGAWALPAPAAPRPPADQVAALGRAQRAVLASPGDHLEAIVEHAAELFHADAVAVRMADADACGSGVHLAGIGVGRPGSDAPRRHCAMSAAESAVLRTRTAALCGAPHGDYPVPAFLGPHANSVMVALLSELRHQPSDDDGVPTYADIRVDAALVVATTDPGRSFGPLELEILEAYAGACNAALASAHRVGDLQRAYERASTALGLDGLTGLPNRARFVHELDRALERLTLRRGRVGVIFIDLDDFKLINDRYGHETGDRLLIAFAARLQRILRPGELGARLGGDEFVVLLDGIDDRLHGHVMVERIRIALSEPFQLADVTIVAEASFGLAFVDDDRTAELDGAGLLRDADVALYRAKAEGKARSVVFDRSMRDRELADREVASRLRNAVRSSPTDSTGQLELVYQPIIELATGRVAAVEALLRWHDEDGDVQPDDFIPLAEESGLIVALGRWVLETACRDLVRFRTKTAELGLCVNISGRQLADETIVPDVAHALKSAGLPASSLTLEMTETFLLDRSETALARLQELRRLGVRTALDDFGTGCSSLTSLRRFAFDVCKVDRALIDGLDGHASDRELCEMLVNVGLHLGLDVVGEGIETATQLDRLLGLGCQYGQGYHLARPASAEATLAGLPGAASPSA